MPCLTLLFIPTAKPVRPKQLPVCSPTNPFYTYIRAAEHANTYSNALFQGNMTQEKSASITCNPNSVQSNTWVQISVKQHFDSLFFVYFQIFLIVGVVLCNVWLFVFLGCFTEFPQHLATEQADIMEISWSPTHSTLITVNTGTHNSSVSKLMFMKYMCVHLYTYFLSKKPIKSNDLLWNI